MIPKLRAARYAFRSMVHISNINTLISISMHTFISLWNNLLGQFFQQWEDFQFTKENRIVNGTQRRTSCRSLFKQTFYPFNASMYFHYALHYQQLGNFLTNSLIHTINAKKRHNFHRQMLTYIFKKSTFYAGIKMFNSLPTRVIILKNDKAKFKAALR